MRASLRSLTSRGPALVGEPGSTDQWRELVDELHFHSLLAEAGRVFLREFLGAERNRREWRPVTERLQAGI
jgi:hypothetical protein